ncbi:hypothetical protein MKI79_07370 [Acinetobacter sp. A3.8]|uniref:Uncharacterized protein n=1 Tax=Acinetobacter sedimenti TaxID=2919922 RepID=A0A9X1WY32_9GAMM|nr:hypothetical protein [Acinetobacter sedimenti]MCJ8146718.1 hypothetical protein [Acinetobacter sedimenti]
MLEFANFLVKRNEKIKYYNLLKDFLSDGKLDENEKLELEKPASECNLTESELLDAHKKAASIAFKNITSDGKITVEEKESLEELINYFKVSPKDFNFDQNVFNKFYTLGLIDKGLDFSQKLKIMILISY